MDQKGYCYFQNPKGKGVLRINQGVGGQAQSSMWDEVRDV